MCVPGLYLNSDTRTRGSERRSETRKQHGTAREGISAAWVSWRRLEKVDSEQRDIHPEIVIQF